jgi:hypothetical protein
MGFRTSFTPTVSISGVLGFFALAAVTGWLTFPRFAGPRFEVKASILVCDSVPLKGGTVAWKLSLDKAPGEVRLEAPTELDRSLSALCARKPRVRVVSRENNGIFSVQELEDVESGTVLVSESEVLEKSRRQRIRAGAATGVLALLGVVCGVMGLLAARTPAPRRTSSPSPQGRSSPMTPRTSTSPSSRPVSVARGTTGSTVPHEPVPAAPSVSAPLHITPISVELRPSRPRYVPGILAILAFLVGLRPVLKVMSEEGWKPIFGPVLLAAAALALVDFLWAMMPIGTRAMVQVNERSIRVHSEGVVAEFPFDSLQSVDLEEKPYRRNGRSVGLRRVLILRGPQDKAILEHLVLKNREDTFGPVLETLLLAAVDSARRRIAAGRPLRGEGWVLDARALQTETRPAPVPRAHITHVDSTAKGVSVWRRDQREPFFTVPHGSPNARLLLGVLEPAASTAPVRKKGAGSRLFWRTTSIVEPVFGALVGYAMMGAAFFVFAQPPRPHWLAAGVTFGIGCVVLYFCWVKRPHVLSVHERSVKLQQWLESESVTIRDEEVVELGLGTTKVYTKGIYSGTTTELTLVAANGRRIAFKTHGFDVDEDLMAVHARILPSVTQWMKSRLEAGHPVLWGSEAFLKRDGLRLVNTHESLVHPFSGLKFRRDKDVLHVSNWRGGALFSLRASELNFHPCLQLAEELAAAEKSSAASA